MTKLLEKPKSDAPTDRHYPGLGGRSDGLAAACHARAGTAHADMTTMLPTTLRQGTKPGFRNFR